MSAQAVADRWIACWKPRPAARRRLICIPYAGGGASVYHSWVDLIPTDVELLAVQLPGREKRLREQSFTRLDPLVEELAEAIRPRLDRPYAVFGYSLGALIAFELLRTLRRSGDRLASRLFVGARAAPQIDDPNPIAGGLSDEEFIEEIRRRYGGIPDAILREPDLMKLFLPSMRGDFEIIDNYRYRPQPPLDCPISAFGGAGDERVGEEMLEPWRTQTRAEFSLRILPGDHFFLHRDRTLLLEALREDLDVP